MAKVSVITTHWSMDSNRSLLMKLSYETLFATAQDAEILVVDNGDSKEDSEWLLKQSMKGNIACYIRNRKNMHFGYGRNQALKLCGGDYIVIADNDIHYEPGWMEECVSFLERNPGKYLATPIKADPNNKRPVRWCGEVDGWKLNYRAGSNVFMMRRKDWEKIGFFEIHPIAGSKFCDHFTRLGYKVAVMPTPKTLDLGLRQGYNFNDEIKHKSL